MNGKLTKIISENQNLRTNEVIGFFEDLPIKGKFFQMLADPLAENMSFRYISTSMVLKVKQKEPNLYEFSTLYSVYNLEVYEELNNSSI